MELVLFTALIPLAIAIVASMIVITPQQHVRLIETFGKYSHYKSPGLSFKQPWPFQTASRKFSMQTRQITEKVRVKTKDNVFVHIPVAVQFKVVGSQIRQAYYELDDPEGQMKSYITTQIRAVGSDMDFQQLYDDKDEVSSKIQANIGEKMHDYGYQIVDVLVDDPQPTDDIVSAYNDVTASMRAREAATGYAEADRVRRVAKARATGEAQEISAKATVNSRKILAEGNADAIRTSVEGTGLSPEFGHHLVEMSIQAETARDAARHGGKTVIVMGEGGTPLHGLFASGIGSGSVTKPETSARKTEAREKTCALDTNGDGKINL